MDNSISSIGYWWIPWWPPWPSLDGRQDPEYQMNSPNPTVTDSRGMTLQSSRRPFVEMCTISVTFVCRHKLIAKRWDCHHGDLFVLLQNDFLIHLYADHGVIWKGRSCIAVTEMHLFEYLFAIPILPGLYSFVCRVPHLPILGSPFTRPLSKRSKLGQSRSLPLSFRLSNPDSSRLVMRHDFYSCLRISDAASQKSSMTPVIIK